MQPLLEELELALSDRIERSHPRLLERFARVVHGEVRTVLLPDGVQALGPDGPVGIEVPLSILVTPQGSWVEVWIPRLDARLWLAADADVDQAAVDLAAELIADWPPHRRLALRHTGDEAVVPMSVEVVPAPLGAFTGPGAPADMLPEPVPDDPEEPTGPEGRRVPTPTLERLGQPLHELARAGVLPRAFERSDAVQRLVDCLVPGSGPVVVVGPPGVGKGAVLDELAHRLASDEAPEAVRGRPAFFVDAGRLIASDGFFGDWQRQVLDVIQEVSVSDATWFLGELLPLLDAGKSAFSNSNVAQMLTPALGTGDLRVVGECSDADWAQLQLRNPGFARIFTPLRLEDPDDETTARIIAAVAGQLAASVTFADGAVAAILELARRYGQGQSLVGASVQLLRRVADATIADALARPDEDGTVPTRWWIAWRWCATCAKRPGCPRSWSAMTCPSIGTRWWPRCASGSSARTR